MKIWRPKSTWLSTFIAMMLLWAFTACGYNGPKLVYTIELDFQSWATNQAIRPQDALLRQALDETMRHPNARTGNPMDSFEQVIREKGWGDNAFGWFFKEGDLPSPASVDQTCQALRDKWSEATDRLAVRMKKRFEAFPDYDAQIEIQPGSKRLKVTLRKINDMRIAENLIRAQSQLEFFSTYGIQSIGEKMTTGWQALKDADSMDALPDLPKFIHLEEQRAQNQANMGGRDESMVGWALATDTPQVVRLLDTLQSVGNLPHNLKWAWGAKVLEGFDKAMLGLYSLATIDGKPELNGEVVMDAKSSLNLNGMPMVEVTMTEDGAQAWLEMTTANQGRQIAMVIDGAVYSAPYVQEPIGVGRTQITGNFTKQEAEELAGLLKAGELPGRVRVLEAKEIGPPAN